MARSQRSQEASPGDTHCPEPDVGFEDDHVETAQEIPVNEVSENEALSPIHVTDRISFIDLANKQLQTISPEVLSLEYLEELHMEKNQITSIPGDINCLRHVKILYLDQNHIEDIREDLGELQCPLSSDLSNNALSCSSLPVISKLQSLQQLRLYKTNSHEIPVICEYLTHVELLGLADNHLKCLPKEIVNLTKLKEIYLQKNRFGSFPKELCHIANLEIVDLENLISLIPEEVGFLTNLVKLFLAFNNLSSIPPTLQHCQKLAVLDLSHNLLHKLPPGLKNLTEMRVLRLSANSREKFPHQICCWLSLSRVYPRNTGLCTVPRSFNRLTAVRMLDLIENCFADIPKGICTMKNLEVLALDDNQIQEVPAEMKELTNLKCLSLSENEFGIFPKEIFLLEPVERLYLGQNKGIKFTSLPEDIIKFQNLKELHMENNSQYLPAAISSSTHLKILDCRNNLLKQLPDSVCQIQGEKQSLCCGLKDTSTNSLNFKPSSEMFNTHVPYMHRLNCSCLIHVLFLGSTKERSTSFLLFVLQLFAFVCSGLQNLLIQSNPLSQLPKDLGSLQQLELVLVDGNPTTGPPTEACCQGTSAIWEYLQEKRCKKAMNSRALRKPPQYTYKAVLLVIDTLQNNLQGALCNTKISLNHRFHQLWQNSTSITDHVKVGYRKPSGNTPFPGASFKNIPEGCRCPARSQSASTEQP
ncbi:LOW QUALITY PROTEIN: leucine-rich repeat and IQ domain-containing protein 4 [Leptosomus discolor]